MLLLLYFLLGRQVFLLNAQQDTLLVIPAEINSMDDEFDQKYKQYIRQNEPTINHLWKLNLVDLDVPVFSLGYEHKLGKLWSTESYLKVGLPAYGGYYGMDVEWSFSHQLKFYYNLKRREQLGRKTNGFNANYISIGIFGGEERDPKPGYKSDMLKDAESCYGVGLKFGMQRRIGNFFIEPYVGVNYQYYNLVETDGSALFSDQLESGKSGRWNFQPDIGIKAGIALESLFKNYQNIAGNPGGFSLQDSLKRSRVMWKINLVDLRLFMPNLGFEFRLAKNITSDSYVKFGVGTRSVLYDDGQSGFGLEGLTEMGFEQQFKYYHNFKRRESHGRNTLGFSGNYLSLGFYLNSNTHSYDWTYLDLTNRRYENLSRLGLSFSYGLQRRFGDIGYVDVFGGIAYEIYEVPAESAFHLGQQSNQGFVPIFGIRAGLAIGTGIKLKSLLK